MSNVTTTAVERLYGSTEALNKVLDETPAEALPRWSGKPADASITEWGIDQLWTAGHGRHDHGNLADPADEQFYVLAAQAGDEDAWLSLLRAYIPAIQSVVARHAASALANDDVRQTAVEGFLRAVREFDTSKGLRRIDPRRQVSQQLSEQYGSAFTASVPRRTRERVAQILRAAGGDAKLAEELAPEFGMSARTFHEAYEGLQALQPVRPVQDGDGYDFPTDITATVAAPTWVADRAQEPATLEDTELVEAALRSDLSAAQRTAIIFYYGLTGEEPQTDAQIGERLGVSRSRAAHIRLDALAKVRSNINAEEA